MPPRSPAAAPLPAPEDFDLFADVSHHGSSLFEFLSLPPAPSLDASFAPPPGDVAPPPPPPPPQPPQQPQQQQPGADPRAAPPAVDSYCTADPPRPRKPRPAASPRRPPPPASAAARPPGKAIAKPKQRPSPAPRKKSRPPAAAAAAAPGNRTASRSASRASAPSSLRHPESDASDQSHDLRNRVSDRSGNPAGPRGGPAAAAPGTPGADDPASGLLEDGQNKDAHNSHTRRCRAKVNSKFQELLSILPAPPPNTGIKHKAQILDYTIRVFRDVHARKTLLEAELALSSRSQLQSWIANVISRSKSWQDALAPYLSLICTKGGWKYSEAWVPAQEPAKDSSATPKFGGAVSVESRVLTAANIGSSSSSRLRMGLAVIPSLGNTDDPDLQSKLERFRDRSRSYGCKARIDLPGRVMCTMRPEWLPSLTDQEAFQRARLARAATLVVCFGVPIFVRGHVAAVAVFFDTEQRAYDAKCVDLADNIACLLGNSFGANTFSKKPL